ncbi:lateral signaling target protein 2 homolog isoform X2 [Eurytemora carolleeae]|nr:lateral signaling target protein 2 homolog isoform X2 [Eurytemora carolleeae]XP_023337512.1 lateral signaling target protein 2 homolog isoform X2 [Eurytemora carolleeae]XP_023337513.1 lateral signaling target protein 2 homolog isoform X2 [Eurytemora carolleeae]|eukprot:XP_023337511.1 lateral signaling target protein 2 homolog isoform X2 [Eurytemora affinis]
MISIRKWLYKPRRDDKSLFAKFWYADDNLNRVAAELDSFDGRKDPERCASLVSRLRSCQDKLLNICNRMLDELEQLDGRANREFRVKFPDEIVTENLGGQLWFGAECLAAGSSIMQKEFESVQMRPLAKAVTKTLEKVRGLIREQCLSPTPQYTEQIHETLKIFDRLFAEFEFSYVSCMVHVKTIKEYEIHQDVICLFSETLQRSLKNQLVTQDMVDQFDPSLMFAIPRLAIVCGLLIFPNGPLNVDREYADFPELFRPFKNLLRKIRELLWTLSPAEFYVLERLLCQLEEPDNLEMKLQTAQRDLNEKLRISENQETQESQAALLDAKLCSVSSIPCICDTNTSVNCDSSTTHPSQADLDSSRESDAASGSPIQECARASSDAKCAESSEDLVRSILEDIINASTNSNRGRRKERSKKEEDELDKTSGSLENKSSNTPSLVKQAVVEIDCSGPDITVSPVKERKERGFRVLESGSTKKGLKRRGAKRYHKTWKDARARFKSSEDLIHRLYVCISGAADQLQTNFAGDFRHILKYVFTMNSTQEEEEEEENEEGRIRVEDEGQDREVSESLSDSEQDSLGEVDELGEGAASLPPGVVRTQVPGSEYECGEDALMNETEQSYLRNFAREPGVNVDPGLISTSPPALVNMPVYASNLDQHIDRAMLIQDNTEENFYQPEPTLLTIASGAPPQEEQEIGPNPGVESPPPWIPDSMAPLCMGCGAGFSLVKRRHHCRSCGRVFCQRCSPNQVPLPRYGMESPVRVCNRCYIYYMNPYEERTVHAYHVYNGTGHGSWGYNSLIS